MKKTLKYILIPVFTLSLGLGSLWGWVMWDSVKLSYFRTCQDTVSKSLKGINLDGLASLPVSGSNRLLFDDLKAKLNHIKGKIYIVDLTGGGQTYYKGEYPIDFFGLDSKHPEWLKYKLRRWYFMGSMDATAEKDFWQEKDVVEKHGYSYVNLYQQRRETPGGQIVDHFIELVENLPQDGWLHLHCRGGKGRTTSFMVLFDILKNGRKVSLEDIVKRHHLLGGIDLFDTKVWKNGTYTESQLTRRRDFIMNFYRYVNDSQGYGHQSWMNWCKVNGIKDHAKLN